jgi:hypothetical protein
MSTLAQITAAIDDDIRNKTPLVLKVEHADVEQLITDEMFPDSAKLEWNGASAIDPIADIVCNPALTGLAKIEFKIYFEKVGNHVFVNGYLTSQESSVAIGNILLATFPTNIYKPLATHITYAQLIQSMSSSTINISNASLYLSTFGTNLGLYLIGSIPPSPYQLRFSFHYKVAN